MYAGGEPANAQLSPSISRGAVQQYLKSYTTLIFGNLRAVLALAEVMEFDNNFYA